MDRSAIEITLLYLSATVLSFFSALENHDILSHSKPTWQSGTATYRVGGVSYNGDARNAVDDSNETCTRTKENFTSWWVVDLQGAYLVQQVAITPRVKKNSMKLFTVEVSLNMDRTTGELEAPWLCHQQHDDRLPPGTASLLPCYRSAMGRFVRITKTRTDTSTLSVCHVDVYGVKTERSYSLVVRPGKRATGRIIEKVFTRDAVRCLNACLKQPECTSFDMAAENGTCDLIADTDYTFSENEQFANGWTRYIVGVYEASLPENNLK